MFIQIELTAQSLEELKAIDPQELLELAKYMMKFHPRTKIVHWDTDGPYMFNELNKRGFKLEANKFLPRVLARAPYDWNDRLENIERNCRNNRKYIDYMKRRNYYVRMDELDDELKNISAT